MGARPLSEDGIAARHYGVSTRIVKRFGGAAKLDSLSEEAKSLLLKPWKMPSSKELRMGGLKRRGFKRATDIRSQDV